MSSRPVLQMDSMRPIGSHAGTSSERLSSALKLTRSRSGWCSELILLQHHCLPQKKIPKVCNIVGGVVSPLLANIALHGLEEVAAKVGHKKREQPVLIRYADDFLIFLPEKDMLEKATEAVTSWLKDIGLSLSPKKTRVTHT